MVELGGSIPGQGWGKPSPLTVTQTVRRLSERIERAECRVYPRRSARLGVWITIDPSDVVIRTETVNISDGGVYVTTVGGMDLACGQTVQLRVVRTMGGSFASGRTVLQCVARVVRTELLLTERDSQTGWALEFALPQLLSEFSERTSPRQGRVD